MSFPVPVEYGMNESKDNIIVKYNNGDQWEGMPSPGAGGGGGDDEEGEDTMVVTFSWSDGAATIDKTWLEISNACVAGKNVIGYFVPSDWYETPDGETSTTLEKYDLSFLQHSVDPETSQEYFTVVFYNTNDPFLHFTCQNATDIPVYQSGDD